MSLQKYFNNESSIDGGFTPFLKFEKDGDFLVGEFQEMKVENIKNNDIQQIYLILKDTNIKKINVGSKNGERKIKEGELQDKIVKFAPTADILRKISKIEDLQKGRLIGFERKGVSETISNFGKKMILFDVRV